MKKQLPLILRSAGFMLLVHAIATILALVSLDFSDNNKIITLSILTVILVCLIPTYFTVKVNVRRPWFYLAVSAISYIIMGIISYIILKITLTFSNQSAFYAMNAEIYIWIVEAVVGIYFLIVALLDAMFIIFKQITAYVKGHRAIVISFIAGAVVSLLTVSLFFTVSSIKNFDCNIYAIMPPRISYVKDGKHIESHETSLDSNFAAPLTLTDSMYFGKVDESEYIHISVKDIADIYIYPHNDESIILEYNPRGFGFTQRYKAHENFAYYMQELYKQTGNEGFNIYPED
jgi:hypothetical protein